MTTGLYEYGTTGTIDLLSDDIRAILVNQLYTPHLDTHQVLDDIPEVCRATKAIALTSRTITDNVFDANDLKFLSVVEGLGFPITGVVLYAHNTGILLGFFDNLYNLPLMPDGRDIVIMWPDDAARIFSWT